MLLRLMSFWILLGSTTHFPSLKRKLHPICYVHLLTKEEFFFFINMFSFICLTWYLSGSNPWIVQTSFWLCIVFVQWAIWFCYCNSFLTANLTAPCYELFFSSTGRKVDDPELLEAIRLTIINNLLQYHPVIIFWCPFLLFKYL
jgi:hypothetical protein